MNIDLISRDLSRNPVDLVQTARSMIASAPAESRGFETDLNLESLNAQFDGTTPRAIIKYTLKQASNPVVFTNFRPLAIALIVSVTQIRKDIPIVWIDHGFNTLATYRYIDRVVAQYGLNLQVYTPKISAAHYLALHGEIPALGTPEHAAFSSSVKLEPFNRAMRDFSPDAWFTGIRHDQNTRRKEMDIFTQGDGSTVRVAPMFQLRSSDLEKMILKQGLPNEVDYYDPTKGEQHRECGIIFDT